MPEFPLVLYFRLDECWGFLYVADFHTATVNLRVFSWGVSARAGLGAENSYLFYGGCFRTGYQELRQKFGKSNAIGKGDLFFFASLQLYCGEIRIIYQRLYFVEWKMVGGCLGRSSFVNNAQAWCVFKELSACLLIFNRSGGAIGEDFPDRSVYLPCLCVTKKLFMFYAKIRLNAAPMKRNCG